MVPCQGLRNAQDAVDNLRADLEKSHIKPPYILVGRLLPPFITWQLNNYFFSSFVGIGTAPAALQPAGFVTQG